MNIETYSKQSIRQEVIHIISSLKKINPEKLQETNNLTALNLDILDVVEIILEIEKSYNICIPDDVPVYTVDDFVNFVYSHQSDAV